MHIPTTKDIPAEPLDAVKQVVGIDLGPEYTSQTLTMYPQSQGRRRESLALPERYKLTSLQAGVVDYETE